MPAQNKPNHNNQIDALMLRLRDGAGRLGLELSQQNLEQFKFFFEQLENKRKLYNLTSLEGQDIIDLHFLDSLSLIQAFSETVPSHMLDLGSGAGFPGMPLKLVMPEVEVTFLDAREKRLFFIRQLASDLGLGKINFIHARAEDAAHGELRESYDIAVARAVAELKTLLELLVPFVKVGGEVVAMKSQRAENELEQAMAKLPELGLEHKQNLYLTLPGTNVERALLIFSKTSETPSHFPRNPKKIGQDN